MKTTSVHFYVQRHSSYLGRGVIPWEYAQVNAGNAMDLKSGVFTAPKDGIYHFHFSGINYGVHNNADNSTEMLGVHIRRNGVMVGKAIGSYYNYETAALHSTFQLKQGDRIDLFLWSGGLYDASDCFNHFTGWLDEEDVHF